MFARYLRTPHLNLHIRTLFSCGTLAAGLSLTTFPASHAQESGNPVVTVTGGQVQGRLLPAPGGAVFKGIPYAAPPVGDLRWREPRPVKPWTGVRQAYEFTAGCGEVSSQPGPAKVSEGDCLDLNVWSPEWPAKAKRPVILWINGGELFGGSGALRPGAESLARHGVILVSATYRGNLLGMMGSPELTAESPHHSSGNYCLLDELAVLNWIHNNIARFGGDPGNVTVFGQSGGARVISMLLVSPLIKGLIHRAIIDSGSPMFATRPYLTLHELEQIGVVTGQVLEAPATDTIKYLRGLPASEIAAAMPVVRQRLLEMNAEAYDEGTDGYVIPQPPSEVWEAHKEAKIPVMIGNTGLDTLATIDGAVAPGANTPPEEALAWEKKILELFYAQDPDLLERARKTYGLEGTPNEVSTYPAYGTPAQQVGIDLNHRCGTQMSAALHSNVAPTWLFEFTRTTPGHLPTHGSELRYVFGYDDIEDADSRKQSDIMQQYWTNFAKSGDPNGVDLPAWPKYSVTAKQSLEFATDGPIQRSASRAAACAPFIEKYTRHPKLLSNGENARVRGPAAIPGTPAAPPASNR